MIIEQVCLLSRVEGRDLIVDSLEGVIDRHKERASNAFLQRGGKVELAGKVDVV